MHSGPDEQANGTGWERRVQWILDEYEDGSRRAMGRKVGLSGQAISAWARGETKPSGEGLAGVIRSYPDVRARWLLTGQGPPRVDDAGRLREGGDGELRARRRSPPPGSADGASEGRSAVERAYEAGRRDAVEEMRAMLGEIAAAT